MVSDRGARVFEGVPGLWSLFAAGPLEKAQTTTQAARATSAVDLSRRERDVAQLLAQGLSNRAIGERLYLSERTIDNHVQNIMNKLDLHHRSELVKYALRKGLLQPDAPGSELPRPGLPRG